MKCPNDQTEMEKGKTDRGMWLKGEIGSFWRLWVGKPVGTNSYWLEAWRCPKCDKVELYTEQKPI